MKTNTSNFGTHCRMLNSSSRKPPFDPFTITKVSLKFLYKTLSVMVTPICKWFPGQLPAGILREAEVAESNSMVAEERAPCKGLCLLGGIKKVTYKMLWVATFPLCKLLFPTGR